MFGELFRQNSTRKPCRQSRLVWGAEGRTFRGACENAVLVLLVFSLALAFFDGTTPARAEAARVGKEAVVDLPTAAEWNGIINFRPGDGEEVGINPPIFSWSYTPSPVDIDKDNAPKEFVLQVSTDAGFVNKVVDQRTPSNLYNFLAPFATNTTRTFYWRVGYIRSTNKVWTLSQSGWESSPYSWSSPRTFTIAIGATNWDRSMLADPGYLADKGQHPHLLFNARNRTAISNWLALGGAGKSWVDAVKQARNSLNAYWGWTNITNETWWATKTTPSDGIVSDAIANMALVWQMTGESIYTNCSLEEGLSQMASHFLDTGADQKDWITGGNGGMIRSLAFGYDWLYETMTAEQRANTLHAIERHCHWVINDGFWRFPKAPAERRGDPTGLYAGGLLVTRTSAGKRGASHYYSDMMYAMPMALSAYADSGRADYPESGAARELLYLGVNYLLGKVCFYGTDEGYVGGRPYSEMFLEDKHSLHDSIFCQIVFPEARFNLNPYWKTIADWWGRMVPVGFTEGHDPFGDGLIWGHFNSWEENNFGAI